MQGDGHEGCEPSAAQQYGIPRHPPQRRYPSLVVYSPFVHLSLQALRPSPSQ